MVFAWQGFRLEHPDDWSPVSLVGDRKEGYVRVVSSGRLAIHVRWASGKNKDPLKSLGQYLDRLSQVAQKKKVDFKRDVNQSSYSYRGIFHGRGTVICKSGRIYFVEVQGGRTDSTLPTFKQVSGSFSVQDVPEEWSLFGLRLILPQPLELKSKTLLAGRTTVQFAGGCQLKAERWAFAEQLLSKHSLKDWSQAVTRSTKAKIEEDGDRIRLIHPSSLLGSREIIVIHQPDRNQLVLVDSRFRKDEWRPQWDWLI